MKKNVLKHLVPVNLTVTLIAAAFLFCLSNDALAGSVGTSIGIAKNNMSPAVTLMSYVSYILGAIIFVRALILVNAHTERPDRVPLSQPIYHFIGGTFLITLPVAFGMLQRTFGIEGSGSFKYLRSAASAPGAAPPNSLDGMLISFVNDVRGPGLAIISAISILVGVYLIISGFLRLARNGGRDGPQGALGGGTIMRLVVGAALTSIGTTSDLFTATLFGTGTGLQFTGLNPAAFGGGASVTRLNNAIKAGLLFFQIIGFISFIRGFMMLRAMADGNQGSTTAAFTHIFGGAVAFNISPALSAIQNTFGLGTSILQF